MSQETTQSKYIKKRKADSQPQIEENEVRIKGNQGNVKRYVDYACRLLQGLPDNRRKKEEKTVTQTGNQTEDVNQNNENNVNKEENATDDKEKNVEQAEVTKNNETEQEKKEKDENKEQNKDNEDGKDDSKQDEKNDELKDENKRFDTIVLKATGRAINKAVTTAEVVKRRISGLHQVTTLETLEITDVWEPTEEGLKEVETTRRVASITITLSRNENDIDKNAAGYQPPISPDNIKPFYDNLGGMDDNNRRGMNQPNRPYYGQGRYRGQSNYDYNNRQYGGFNRRNGGRGGMRGGYYGGRRGGGYGGPYGGQRRDTGSPSRSPQDRRNQRGGYRGRNFRGRGMGRRGGFQSGGGYNQNRRFNQNYGGGYNQNRRGGGGGYGNRNF